MLLAGGWHQAFGMREDAVGVALALSGLFELNPLRYTHINAWMRLDAYAARRNSPLHFILRGSHARLLASVGGLEPPAFQSQTAHYFAAWRAAGNTGTLIDMPSHNHFDIALSLGEPDGALAKAVADAIGRS